jgi:hypothetical protein
MRNCVHQNHTTLQLKLKKQFIYKYYAIIPYRYKVEKKNKTILQKVRTLAISVHIPRSISEQR